MTAPGPALAIGREPFDGPVAQALVAELDADIDRRYAGVDGGEGAEAAPAWAIRDAQVRPPLGAFLVARLDGVPVGCAAVRPLPGGPAGVAEVKRMYTTVAGRRRGIGRLLLASIEAEAVALGYHQARMETGELQPEAIALYESAGYHRIPDFGPYKGHPLTVCLAKDLP